MLAIVVVTAACGDSSDDGNAASGGDAAEHVTLRLGYFPNITHAQPIVGLARGTFAEDLGANVTLETKTFNAGPAAIEALFAGAIDATYIGPNPAINGYVQSGG
jgi:NitT/TauT family transport system substrate-binding protein